MRTIEVETDVFATIWANRLSGEDSESAILRRLLSGSKEQKLVASEAGFASAKLEMDMAGKIRWVDDIMVALRELGGEANLSDIYDAVRIRRKIAGRSVTREYKATVRRTLEDHSSDSANHRADDLFALVGRGVWAIR